MADTSLTPAEFKVDLAQLKEAISTVSGCAEAIATDTGSVVSIFQQAESVWRSPAGTSFVELQGEFTSGMQQLNDLLAEMVRRMQSAYDQYHDTETQNTSNFDAGSGSGNSGGPR